MIQPAAAAIASKPFRCGERRPREAAIALALALAVAGRCGASAAGEPARVTELPAAERALLADGRVFRLHGVVVPGTGNGPEGAAVSRGAQELAAAFALGRDSSLEAVGRDRHGAILGDLRVEGRSLSRELVAAGLAWVGGDGPPAATRDLLAAEAEARRSDRGLWGAAALAEQPSDRVAADPPRFAVVVGTARRAAPREPFLYLDFGADWRTDFTVRLAESDLRRLKRAGLDPGRLVGQNLRVRGWIVDGNGPMIDVVEPGQIETVTVVE